MSKKILSEKADSYNLLSDFSEEKVCESCSRAYLHARLLECIECKKKCCGYCIDNSMCSKCELDYYNNRNCCHSLRNYLYSLFRC